MPPWSTRRRAGRVACYCELPRITLSTHSRESENHRGKRQPYSLRLEGDWKNYSPSSRLPLEKPFQLPFELPFELLRRFGAGS